MFVVLNIEIGIFLLIVLNGSFGIISGVVVDDNDFFLKFFIEYYSLDFIKYKMDGWLFIVGWDDDR